MPPPEKVLQEAYAKDLATTDSLTRLCFGQKGEENSPPPIAILKEFLTPDGRKTLPLIQEPLTRLVIVIKQKGSQVGALILGDKTDFGVV